MKTQRKFIVTLGSMIVCIEIIILLLSNISLRDSPLRGQSPQLIIESYLGTVPLPAGRQAFGDSPYKSGDSAQVALRDSPLRGQSLQLQEANISKEFELLGVAMSSPKDPIAFIKDLESGKQGMFRRGNTIRATKIIEVSMKEVIIERNGQKGILKLSKRGQAWSRQKNNAILTLSDEQIFVSKSGLLNEFGRDYKTLSKVKIKPHFEANQVVKGIMIEEVPEGSIIEAAGIQSNDIVTKVNSQAIDSYQKALQVFKKAKNQQEIKIGFLRNGEMKFLTYQIGN